MYADTYPGSGHHCTKCGKHFCRCPDPAAERAQLIEENRRFEKWKLECQMEKAFKQAAAERRTLKYKVSKFLWGFKRLFSWRSASS